MRRGRRTGVYRRTSHAIYPGGDGRWRDFRSAQIEVVLSCWHSRFVTVPVHGPAVGVPPDGLRCKQCEAQP